LFCFIGWLESVGSRVVYELDYKKPILYVIPIQSILGKLPVVPVGDTGTIPHHLRNTFSGAPGDRRPGAGDGCTMWFVNSWALGWSLDMYLSCNESLRVAAREAAWRKVPCEHPASPCLGRVIVGSGRAATIPLGSSGSASPILTLGRICGSAASVPLPCGGANTVLIFIATSRSTGERPDS